MILKINIIKKKLREAYSEIKELIEEEMLYTEDLYEEIALNDDNSNLI